VTGKDKPDFEGMLKSLLKGRSPEEEEKAEAARQEAEQFMIREGIKWLEEKWGAESESSPCPYCGHNTYAIQAPVNVHPLGRPNRVRTYFPVTCTNCGQTTFVDLAVVGVFEAMRNKDQDEGE
jgi:predicted nucleic-acid-binding Zn-ribbon protein